MNASFASLILWSLVHAVDPSPADVPAGPHHVLDPHQLASQRAGGVVKREILGREGPHPRDQ